MSLPNPPVVYTQKDQIDLRSELDRMDRKNLKRGKPIGSDTPIRQTSPNGTVWQLGVSDAGDTVWIEVTT